MNDFDTRWQQWAARARQALEREDTAPFAFAGRVVARAFSRKELSDEEVFRRVAFRMLAGALGVLVFCIALEAPHLRGARPLETGVENAVAQVVWSL